MSFQIVTVFIIKLYYFSYSRTILRCLFVETCSFGFVANLFSRFSQSFSCYGLYIYNFFLN